jgi:hypothetical protein
MTNQDGTRIQLNVPYTLRVAKLMADELRIKIVLELNMREMSPKEFFEEFGGGSLPRVSRAFDLLFEYGWLHLVRTETGGKRRGAVEHFYRATQPAVFYNDIWSPLPKSMKEMISGGIFEELVARVRAAMEAGTIDAREDRHLSWIPLRLDEQGWGNVLTRIDGIFHWLFEGQQDANLRMAKSGEKPIPMTVALAAFESPTDTEKQP